jgi:hypothetical protein
MGKQNGLIPAIYNTVDMRNLDEKFHGLWTVDTGHSMTYFSLNRKTRMREEWM